MSKIRVGFILDQVGWLGGVNYFRNLFMAIQSQPDLKIQPVVFAGSKSDVSAFEGLAEIIRMPILDRRSFLWCLSKFMARIFPKRDYLLYLALKRYRIDLISHVGELWRGCSIPSIGWIPDFQHIHLPQFFTKQEIATRDKTLLNRIHRSSAVLLSSEDALNDLRSFSPQSTTSAHVLHFISCLQHRSELGKSEGDIRKQYGLNFPWFHVPNQFWAHKNHNVLIEALHLLKKRGKDVLVVATGSTTDHRNPDYFSDVQRTIKRYGLEENFKILGILPYPDVVSLMRHSVAVINPSLFEGWSTTVEEAKSLGKKILLSNIPVHREQAPERGIFFAPHQASDLAEEMISALSQFDPIVEEEYVLHHQRNLNNRKYKFAKNYENIVLQVMRDANKHLHKGGMPI